MTITIHKKSKQEPGQQAQPEVDLTLSDQGIIEELEDTGVFNDLNDVNGKIKVLKEKLKALEGDRAYYEAQVFSAVDYWRKPHETVTGTLSSGEVVEITAHGKTTKVVDPERTFTYLEDVQEGLAYELVTFPITKLREYLSKPQFDKVTAEEYSAKRQVKIK